MFSANLFYSRDFDATMYLNLHKGWEYRTEIENMIGDKEVTG